MQFGSTDLDYHGDDLKDLRPLPRKTIPITEVPIRSVKTGEVAFIISFYGAKARDFRFVPGGAEPIMRALERRGLSTDEFFATIWEIYDIEPMREAA